MSDSFEETSKKIQNLERRTTIDTTEKLTELLRLLDQSLEDLKIVSVTRFEELTEKSLQVEFRIKLSS